MKTEELPDVPNKLVAVIGAANDTEARILQWRATNSWPHVRPNSVYLAAIGNHWAPGAWAKVADMVVYTNQQGIACWFQEIQDRCFNPYDALGTMRNEAVIDATNAGFEFICMIDCDALPQPDTLVRLLKWDMPIVAPYIVEPGSGKPLHGPTREINTGLQPVRWCVLTMLLFRTTVFHCVGPRFWGDAIGADEGYHFKTLWHYAHHPYIDTNTPLIAQKVPIYPLADNSKLRVQEERVASQAKAHEILGRHYAPGEIADIQQWIKDAAFVDGRAEEWRRKLERKALPPDRRPLDSYSPYIFNGEYMPFSAVNQASLVQGTGTATPGKSLVALPAIGGTRPK